MRAPRAPLRKRCGTGVMVWAAFSAKAGSAYEATSIVTESPVRNSDGGDQSSIWEFSWSRLSGFSEGAPPPPSLVKCAFATLAGSIFAVLGIIVEHIRGRNAKAPMTQEEIGQLLPKAAKKADNGGGAENSGASNRSGEADSNRTGESPAVSSRPSFSALRFGKPMSDIDQAERQVKSILNKLTREKFDSLYVQLRDCCTTAFPSVVDRTEIVDVVARDTFDKATQQHTFIEMYADLCAKLHADLEEQGIEVNFKRVLLDQCQQSFKTYMEPPKIDEQLDYEERYEQLVKYKTKMLGNIRLVGHLLIRRMLSPKIIFHCTDELLSIGSEEAVETLCVFVETIGKTFDSPDWKWQTRLQEVFTRMELLTEGNQQSSRNKCLLKDVLDLKNRNWREPAEPKGPKPSAQSARPVSEADSSTCWRSTSAGNASPVSWPGSDHGAVGSAGASPGTSGYATRAIPTTTSMKRLSEADSSGCWRSTPSSDAGSTSPPCSPHASPYTSEARLTRRTAPVNAQGKGCSTRSPIADSGHAGQRLARTQSGPQ